MTTRTTGLPRKDLFDIPSDIVYLDGNSLGPPLRGSAQQAVEVVSDEWEKDLIQAWNSANWMSMPRIVGDQIAPVIGVQPGSVAMGDTLSIKAYQALAAALDIRPDRRVILSDSGNFPTDLYIAQGLIDTLDRGHKLATPPPDEVEEHIDEEVAVVYLTHVDYRTGRMHDMDAITKRAHECGAVTIWDLAHSAGAVPLEMRQTNTEFAVGCTYKFLNGGPGAPAFIYIRPDIVNSIRPALTGWLGHKDPFAMDLRYDPAMSTERFRIGTPPVVQFKLLHFAMKIWDLVDMSDIRLAATRLSELFIEEVERRCPILDLVSPRNASNRGSQVSFASDEAYSIIQALIDSGVIGDFREPNILRFGIAPLYLDENDMVRAAETLEHVMKAEIWREPKYQVKKQVT
ncbi:MAG: kynureninase [Gammaproteobacteria bacterium]|nr:kynureninase [Gammaproteobacteria bacterium]